MLEVAIGILCVMVGLVWLRLEYVLKEVKKGNKDQQEIKTRLAWIKKRQLGEA